MLRDVIRSLNRRIEGFASSFFFIIIFSSLNGYYERVGARTRRETSLHGYIWRMHNHAQRMDLGSRIPLETQDGFQQPRESTYRVRSSRSKRLRSRGRARKYVAGFASQKTDRQIKEKECVTERERERQMKKDQRVVRITSLTRTLPNNKKEAHASHTDSRFAGTLEVARESHECACHRLFVQFIRGI